MEFDKSRVYTVLNADELPIGSKVFVSDSLSCLKKKVESASDEPPVLYYVKAETTLYRFVVETEAFALAYLVEEPSKLKWTDLKIGDIIKNGSTTAMVTAISSEKKDIHILAGDVWFNDIDLKYWRKVEDENNN